MNNISYDSRWLFLLPEFPWKENRPTIFTTAALMDAAFQEFWKSLEKERLLTDSRMIEGQKPPLPSQVVFGGRIIDLKVQLREFLLDSQCELRYHVHLVRFEFPDTASQQGKLLADFFERETKRRLPKLRDIASELLEPYRSSMLNDEMKRFFFPQ